LARRDLLLLVLLGVGLGSRSPSSPGVWTLLGGAIVIGAVVIQILADSPRVTGTP
jgi:hypothetical protein